LRRLFDNKQATISMSSKVDQFIVRCNCYFFSLQATATGCVSTGNGIGSTHDFVPAVTNTMPLNCFPRTIFRSIDNSQSPEFLSS
jgi:hypothetical protein